MTETQIAILLAVYGAFVSTVLGVKEILKDRRRVKIRIHNPHHDHTPWMTVTNTARRPVSITMIDAQIFDEEHGRWQTVPRASIFYKPLPLSEFPIRLEDGEPWSYALGSELEGAEMAAKTIRVWVHDAEGEVHTYVMKPSKSYKKYLKESGNVRK